MGVKGNITLSQIALYTILKCCTIHSRPGTSSTKTANFSQNCAEVDCAGNGIEIAFSSLWLPRIQKSGRW
jgi:hypothetical protein